MDRCGCGSEIYSHGECSSCYMGTLEVSIMNRDEENAALRKRVEELEEKAEEYDEMKVVRDATHRRFKRAEKQIAALISAGGTCGLAISHGVGCPVLKAKKVGE